MHEHGRPLTDYLLADSIGHLPRTSIRAGRGDAFCTYDELYGRMVR